MEPWHSHHGYVTAAHLIYLSLFKQFNPYTLIDGYEFLMQNCKQTFSWFCVPVY
jgi:hypothetical protein